MLNFKMGARMESN